MPYPPIVVMGISGCGKSTIGRALALTLGTDFIDADDLHTAANKTKMAMGTGLDDADRQPWLENVARALTTRSIDGSAPVIACSALTRAYRDILRATAPSTFFAHLAGPVDVVEDRLRRRTHEFMSPSLLQSQAELLEPLEDDEIGIAADLRHTPAELVESFSAAAMAIHAMPSRELT